MSDDRQSHVSWVNSLVSLVVFEQCLILLLCLDEGVFKEVGIWNM